MRCRYINVKDIGKVLIPECMGTAAHYDADNPLEFCTCNDELTPASFERKQYNAVVAKLQKEIKELRKENEWLRKHLITNN